MRDLKPATIWDFMGANRYTSWTLPSIEFFCACPLQQGVPTSFGPHSVLCTWWVPKKMKTHIAFLLFLARLASYPTSSTDLGRAVQGQEPSYAAFPLVNIIWRILLGSSVLTCASETFHVASRLCEDQLFDIGIKPDDIDPSISGRWLELELKLVADVGIVGAPNAGKSTLLSAITAAQPSIANYPFTTLLPNLGVASLGYDETIIVADLPGLLEGAHKGFGLGHEFLRHTERCAVLVHVVDGSSQQPEYEFDAVRLELELFSPLLSEKLYLVAFNKMDLPEACEKWDSFKEYLKSRGIEPLCISAMYRQGTHEIISAANALLQKERTKRALEGELTCSENLDHVADSIEKQRSASMKEFEIFHESNSSTWHVVGAGIERFVQMTNWRYNESLKRFQHALEACGVYKALRKQGVKEGDTVVVCELEMIWNSESEQTGASGIDKQFSGSVKWQ